MKNVKVKYNGYFDLLPSLRHKSKGRNINQTVNGVVNGKIVSFLLKTQDGFFRVNKAIKTSGGSISNKGYKTEELAWRYTSGSHTSPNMTYKTFGDGVIKILS